MSFLTDKTVLVTGAGGSIGSELCRQILWQSPRKVIAFDISELGLYNLERELDSPLIHPVLGDVSRDTDVHRVFFRNYPDVVYHAAAYKHVTLCQKNPQVAWRVNLEGTRHMINAAKLYAPNATFVLVSTDKAVNPTCVMGDTKASAEKATRAAGYTVVRLGNVAGSSGSVMPMWREQIARKRPVTITHPGATRYFITPQGAARSIIDASEQAKGGDTFIPPMGEPQHIMDVAQRLGAREFKVVGLRPGEKLHEELFAGTADEVFMGAANV